MKYIYPAIFRPFDDGTEGYFVRFPDIPSCMTEGYSLEEAIYMANDVLYQMMSAYEQLGQKPDNPPTPIRSLALEENEFSSLIVIETKDTTVVKKMVSLPKWMADSAARKHISLSKTLQSALEDRFNA